MRRGLCARYIIYSLGSAAVRLTRGRGALVLLVVEHARFARVRVVPVGVVPVVVVAVESQQGGQVGRRVQEYPGFHGGHEHRFPGRRVLAAALAPLQFLQLRVQVPGEPLPVTVTATGTVAAAVADDHERRRRRVLATGDGCSVLAHRSQVRRQTPGTRAGRGACGRASERSRRRRRHRGNATAIGSDGTGLTGRPTERRPRRACGRARGLRVVGERARAARTRRRPLTSVHTAAASH